MSEVHDNHELHRFELIAEGRLAFSEYRMEGDVIVITHTIVHPALQGKGIGSRLVAGMLEQIRARGLKLRPQCSFVASYIARHPEWKDLLAD